MATRPKSSGSKAVRAEVAQVAESPGKTKKPVAAGYPRVEVASRKALRTWLEANQSSSRGAWIVTAKKHMKNHVGAAEIAEEALCFGWVDSLPRALDADHSMMLVTPRKPSSAWSRLNKERASRLIASGEMAPAGLATVEAAKASGRWTALDEVEAISLPDDLVERFSAAPEAARSHFEAFPRSVKRAILEWILNAKRAETRAKRIEETVTLAEKNVRANQWRQ